MKEKTTTIVDVAKLAGVSIATVSHVINNSRRVNEETRVKVKEAIKSWNYTKTLQECIDDLNKKYIVSDEQKKIVEWLYTKVEEIVEEAK